MRITVDTNALIRFFADDIPPKANLVEKLLKDEEQILIPDVVFPELEYILIKQYRFTREKLSEVYTFLSSQDNVYITNDVKSAIAIFDKTKLDMADCIIAAYSFKDSLASFDRQLLGVEGVRPFWK